MQTIGSVKNLVEQISYKRGWSFICETKGDGFYLQVSVSADADISISPFTGKREPWKGAKHWISRHACDSEIVGCIFGAIQQAEMHEMREWFKFKSRSIYNPHFDVHKLADFARISNMSFRKNAMSMEE